jgi:hypothetical protein
MFSQLQSETARANGAKSHGPVTPQGRATSSRNSLRHGFAAKSVVLPTESNREFQALLDSYIDQFDPQGGVERDLVQTMVAARWRLRRISNIETALLSTELVRRAEDIDEEFSNMDNTDRLAWVFQELADHGQTLSLVVRYEGALNRSYDRAFKQLHVLQSDRRRAQPNEPKPDPDPDPAPAPATPSVVSPISTPRPPSTNMGTTNRIGLLYKDDPSPSESPATTGNVEPQPDNVHAQIHDVSRSVSLIR